MPNSAGNFNAGRWPVIFPNPKNAPASGLLAQGGDLEPETLVSAYGQGIFPWYSEGDPILWWSPDPRCILFPYDFHISSRSLRKIMHSGFEFSMDCAFSDVIKACAAPRRNGNGTWLLPEMRAAYLRLHQLNVAHSVEIWQAGGLVGGVYGVSLGRAFFGESMFRTVSEASRAAICCLVAALKQYGFLFLDCQQASPHMLKMGATETGRKNFLNLLRQALATSQKLCWRQEPADLPDLHSFKS